MFKKFGDFIIAKLFSTDVRRGWILSNIVFAGIPLAFAALSDNRRDTFGDILTYCYALLVVGNYLYYRGIKSRKTQEETLEFENSDTIIWSSLVFTAIFIGLLAEYNSNISVFHFFNCHFWITLPMVIVNLTISLVLTYNLNWPMISKEEAQDRAAK